LSYSRHGFTEQAASKHEEHKLAEKNHVSRVAGKSFPREALSDTQC